MHGKLYGIGVGPGDPELMTLKAMRIMKEADVIVVPGKTKEESVAYGIAKGALPELADKKVVAIHMPMTKDPELRHKSHHNAADVVMAYMNEGKDVAFLTLGDPTIYSTYMYVHEIVMAKGYKTEIISGIPSFCAAAAKLNQGLVQKDEALYVIPSSYGIEEGLNVPGTKVLMKAGKTIDKVVEAVKTSGRQASMVVNCGMADEKVYRHLDEIEGGAGYYTLMIVKEK